MSTSASHTSDQPVALFEPRRHNPLQARVVWGDHVVTVGGDAPVRVQSMTNTDTVDVIGTAIQVKELATTVTSCSSTTLTVRKPCLNTALTQAM